MEHQSGKSSIRKKYYSSKLNKLDESGMKNAVRSMPDQPILPDRYTGPSNKCLVGNHCLTMRGQMSIFPFTFLSSQGLRYTIRNMPLPILGSNNEGVTEQVSWLASSQALALKNLI